MSEQNLEQFPKVEPHGNLTKIIEDVWYVTGSVVFKPLVRLVRNMVVIRHNDELTLINCVRLDEAGEKALNALGKVTHIMKIGGHGMDDAYYLDRYKAKHWTINKSRTDNSGTLVEDVELPFPNATLFEFKDTIYPETAIIIDRSGGLLITCDSVQHWVPSKLMSTAGKIITRLLGFQKPAQIGPKWREKQTAPNSSLRADFDRLVTFKFDRIIGGHGGLLENNGDAVLRETIKRELD